MEMNETVYKVKPCCKNIIFYKLEFIESERGRPKPAFENYVRQKVWRKKAPRL